MEDLICCVLKGRVDTLCQCQLPNLDFLVPHPLHEKRRTSAATVAEA